MPGQHLKVSSKTDICVSCQQKTRKKLYGQGLCLKCGYIYREVWKRILTNFYSKFSTTSKISSNQSDLIICDVNSYQVFKISDIQSNSSDFGLEEASINGSELTKQEIKQEVILEPQTAKLSEIQILNLPKKYVKQEILLMLKEILVNTSSNAHKKIFKKKCKSNYKFTQPDKFCNDQIDQPDANSSTNSSHNCNLCQFKKIILRKENIPKLRISNSSSAPRKLKNHWSSFEYQETEDENYSEFLTENLKHFYQVSYGIIKYLRDLAHDRFKAFDPGIVIKQSKSSIKTEIKEERKDSGDFGFGASICPVPQKSSVVKQEFDIDTYTVGTLSPYSSSSMSTANSPEKPDLLTQEEQENNDPNVQLLVDAYLKILSSLTAHEHHIVFNVINYTELIDNYFYMAKNANDEFHQDNDFFRKNKNEMLLGGGLTNDLYHVAIPNYS